MTTFEPRAETAASQPTAEPVGAVRAGAMLFAATVGASVTTYLFLLIAGRVLGPHDYGVLAALLAAVSIMTLPLGAVQLGLSREVSSLEAGHHQARARAFSRRLVILAGWTMGAAAAALLALTYPLAWLLQIDSVGPVALMVLLIAPSALYMVFLGDLQGRQQFPRLAVCLVMPFVGRILAFAVFALVGWRLYGALVAAAIGSAAAVVLAAIWCRDVLRGEVQPAPTAAVVPFVRALLPIAVALAGVTALTNVDVLIVKGALSTHDAGVYAAASTLAKVAFFLPVAIISILFPRVAARRVRGEATDDILGRALIVTAGFCVALFAFYAIASGPIVRLTFGAEFDDAAPLLGLFGFGMTAFSLANVLVSYQLSLGRTRFAWIVAAAAVVQAAVLIVLHDSLEQVLWVNAAVGAALLIAHEAACGSSLPAVRSGLVHLRAEVGLGEWTRDAPERAHDVLIARRAHIVEGAAVLVGCCAFAVFLTRPLALHLGDRFLGLSGDSTATIWNLWRLAEHDGYQFVGTTGQHLTGAPFGWELGNWLLLQQAWPFYPAYLLGEVVGEVVAYNLLVLSGLVLSGAAMYLLVRRIGSGRLAASWAAMVIMTFPWIMEKAQGHTSFVHLEGFPLLLLALLGWRRRPTFPRALLVATALLFLWLTSGYFGVIGTIATAVVLGLAAVSQRQDLGLRRALGRLVVAGSTALGTLVIVGGLLTLGTGPAGLDLGRTAGELVPYGARWWEFLLPHPRNPVFGEETAPFILSHLHGSNLSETSLYVGWLTILLALGWLVWAAVRRRALSAEQRFLAVALPMLVVVAIAFTLPSPITLFGAELQMPSRLLFEATGVFRVPTRFIALVMVALVPLAALGLDRLIRGLRGAVPDRRAGAAIGTTACLVAGTLSFVELSVVPPTLISTLQPLPAEYRPLTRIPPGAIAEYPLAPATGPFEADYLIRQRSHGRPMLGGAPVGTFADRVRDVVVDPAAPGVASTLALLGVRAVMLHPPFYERLGAAAPAALGDGFTRLATGADGSAWRVSATPAPAIATFGAGFGAAEPAAGLPPRRWLVDDEGTVELYAPRAGRYVARFTVESHLMPRRLTITGKGSWERTVMADTVSLVVALPAGRSDLRVTAIPSGEAGPGGAISLYISNWAFEPLPKRSPSPRDVQGMPVHDATLVNEPSVPGA